MFAQLSHTSRRSGNAYPAATIPPALRLAIDYWQQLDTITYSTDDYAVRLRRVRALAKQVMQIVLPADVAEALHAKLRAAESAVRRADPLQRAVYDTIFLAARQAKRADSIDTLPDDTRENIRRRLDRAISHGDDEDTLVCLAALAVAETWRTPRQVALATRNRVTTNTIPADHDSRFAKQS